MEEYSFNLKPENHKVFGCADFSTILTPKDGILTYTNVNTREKEEHCITRTEVIDENGMKKFIYIFPPPSFVNKKG